MRVLSGLSPLLVVTLLSGVPSPAEATVHPTTSQARAGASAAPPILFTASNDAAHLYEFDTIDPATGKITRLTGYFNATQPVSMAWSAVTGQVYWAETLGSDAYRLRDDGSGSPTKVAAANALDISPDGVTYVEQHGGLYVVPVSGGSPAMIADGYSPRFSADGTHVVFGYISPNGQSSIYTVSAHGVGLRRITAAGMTDRPGAYSPDGRRLLFTRVSRNGQDSTVYSVSVDGTNLRLVAPHATDPDWATNGWISYCVLDTARRPQLAVLSPGIPGVQRVLPKTRDDCHPRFRR